MRLPTNHKRYLNKKDYFVSQEIETKLDPHDIENIKKYGYWLDALERRIISPLTKDQEHFLKVCEGIFTPQNNIQRSWANFIKIRNSIVKPRKYKKNKKIKGMSASEAKKKKTNKTKKIEETHNISGYYNQTTRVISGGAPGSKR
jgi:uncharacterized protein YifE (UPF0438 family)